MAINVDEFTTTASAVEERQKASALSGPSAGFKPAGYSAEGFQSASFEPSKFQGYSQTASSGKKMRDDYGWRMTDEQYNAMKADEERLNNQVSQYKSEAQKRIDQYKSTEVEKINQYQSQYEQAKAQYESQYGTAQKTIEEGYNQLGSAPTMDSLFNNWWSTNQVPVRVVDGSNVESVHMMPKSVVDSLNTSVFNKGDGSYTANWVDGGKYYNVGVTPRGTDEKYGKELRTMLSDTSQYKNIFYSSPEVQSTYQQSLAQYQAGRQQLDTAQQTLAQQVAPVQNQLQTAYQNLTAARADLTNSINSAQQQVNQQVNSIYNQRKAQMDMYAKKYTERRANVSKAYQNLKEQSIG